MFRLAKDRGPALRVGKVGERERENLVKEVLGVMGSDGFGKGKDLSLKVGPVYLGATCA